MRTTEQRVLTRDAPLGCVDAAHMTAITELPFVDEDDELALHRTPWTAVLIGWVTICSLVSAASLWAVAR